jgi:hypothetical protein
MRLYGLKLSSVVKNVVDHFGLNAVMEEIKEQENTRLKAEVDALSVSIENFGKSRGIPPWLVRDYLAASDRVRSDKLAGRDPVIDCGGDYVGLHVQDGHVYADFDPRRHVSSTPTKAKPAPVNIGKMAADVITSDGWDFTEEFSVGSKGLTGQLVNLVGQHYRSKKDQDVLASKKLYNMALLVAEPTNVADVNAVMVLMWYHKNKAWHHVGYVRADQAARLRSCWPEDDVRKVRVATIMDMPSGFNGHRTGPNLTMALTGEYRTYPAFQRLV